MSEAAVVVAGVGAGEAASPPLLSVVLSPSTPADFFALLKPRVMTLVVFTGFIGMMVAPGHLHPVLAFASILALAVGAGASGAINMWYERDIDALMRRTAKRPIPAGRVAPSEALGFGVTLAVGSVVVMALAANLVAAAILALSIGFYVFVYTIWLKRRTPQNIVIGGAAGAFPPVIGWAAVTGDVGLLPLLLFAIVFVWTPPHFWSLALWAHDDYERAGVPMLPVVAGARATRRQIVAYTLVLVPLSVLPWVLHTTGPSYGITAAALGLSCLGSVGAVARDRQDAAGVSLTRDKPAKAAFRISILYLFGLFAALAADHFVMPWLG